MCGFNHGYDVLGLVLDISFSLNIHKRKSSGSGGEYAADDNLFDFDFLLYPGTMGRDSSVLTNLSASPF
jgi:hypothetical protein